MGTCLGKPREAKKKKYQYNHDQKVNRNELVTSEVSDRDGTDLKTMAISGKTGEFRRDDITGDNSTHGTDSTAQGASEQRTLDKQNQRLGEASRRGNHENRHEPASNETSVNCRAEARTTHTTHQGDREKKKGKSFTTGFTSKGKGKKDSRKYQNSDSSDSDTSQTSDSEDDYPQSRRPKTHNKAKNMIFGGKNNTINQGSVIYKKSPRKKQRRKERSSKRSTTTLRGPNFSLPVDRQTSMRSHEILVEAGKSVGIIRCPGGVGTGFLVASNLVMTALHVIDHFLVTGTCDIDDDYLEGIHIQFGYTKTNAISDRLLFQKRIRYKNRDLDTVILELKPSESIPRPLSVFGDTSRDLHLIGHPDGGVLKVDIKLSYWEKDARTILEARQWSLDTFGKDGYYGMENTTRLLFHTAFAHGASGAPGMHVNERDSTVIVTTMLLRGYPDIYYNGYLSQEQKETVTNDQKIEEGVSMKHIYRHMIENKYQKLADKVFGSCFEETNIHRKA